MTYLPVSALIFVLSIFSYASEQPSLAQSVQNDLPEKSLIGTWRLVSDVTMSDSGKQVVDQFGERPIGYSIYDGSGHVFAQLMRLNRSEQDMENCGARRGTAESNPTLICGYDAYFGTYRLLGAAEVVHHLEGALAPEDIGKDVRRSFLVEEDRLTIKFVTTVPNGEKATRTIIWERMK